MIRSSSFARTLLRRKPMPLLPTQQLGGIHCSRLLSSTATEVNADSGSLSSWWKMMALVAGSTAAFVVTDNASSTTLCDFDEDEEDPYDNLPEEDEATNCSICMTYRQGPCRPYWKKVEACTKDNELPEKKEGEEEQSSDDQEEQPDPPCLKYMLPWIECATGFRNLYGLIELDTNFTNGIAELEKDATVQACWATTSKDQPNVDWSEWQAYVASHPTWRLPKSSKPSDQRVSLWKTLDQTKDVEVVEVQATVNMTKDEGILECAYAVDQNGHVLGFAYGQKPSEAQARQKDSDDDQPATVDLKIRLLPEHTRHVVLAAAYTQPLPTEPPSKQKDSPPVETHIFKSQPYSLKKVAK